MTPGNAILTMICAVLTALLVLWASMAWAEEPERYSLGHMNEPWQAKDWIEFRRLNEHSVEILYHNRTTGPSDKGVSDPVFNRQFTYGGLSVTVNLRLNIEGSGDEEIRVAPVDETAWAICPPVQIAQDGETVALMAHPANFGCGMM